MSNATKILGKRISRSAIPANSQGLRYNSETGEWAFADSSLESLSGVEVSADLVSRAEPKIFNSVVGSDESGLLSGTFRGYAQKIVTTEVNRFVASAQFTIDDPSQLDSLAAGMIVARLYSEEAGLPGSLLSQSDYTALTSVAGQSETEIIFSFSAPYQLTPGTSYWIAIEGDNDYYNGVDYIAIQKSSSTSGGASYSGSVWEASSSGFALVVTNDKPASLGTSDAPWENTQTNKINGWTFPTMDGSSGDILSTNGNKILTFVAPGGAPSGCVIRATRSVSGDTTLNASTDFKLLVDVTADDVDVTFPDGVSGQEFVVKSKAGANNINLIAHAGDSIESGWETVPAGDGLWLSFDAATSTWLVISAT